jgi:hypothetical protein
MFTKNKWGTKFLCAVQLPLVRGLHFGQCFSDCAYCVGFFQQWHLSEPGRYVAGRAAGTEQEGYAASGNDVGNWPDLPVAKIAVENGHIKAPGLSKGASILQCCCYTVKAQTKGFEKILEHYCDHRFIFDDED